MTPYQARKTRAIELLRKGMSNREVAETLKAEGHKLPAYATIQEWRENLPLADRAGTAKPQSSPADDAENIDLELLVQKMLADAGKDYEAARTLGDQKAMTDATKRQAQAAALLHRVRPRSADVDKMPSTKEAAARARSVIEENIRAYLSRRDR